MRGIVGDNVARASGVIASAASSDFVKIASGTHSGTSLVMDNIFTSAYKIYQLHLYNCVNDGGYLSMRGREGGASGTSYTSATYRYRTYVPYKTSSTSTTTGESSWADDHVRMNTWACSADQPDNFTIDFVEPQSTSYRFRARWHALENSSSMVGTNIGAFWLNTGASTVFTGLEFYENGGGSFDTGYALYGLKV